MAKKRGRKSPKRVAAGRKAARTRKRRKAMRRTRRKSPARVVARRRWRRLRGKRRRLTVKRTRRGLTRSPYSRLGYRKGRKVRVNPRFSVRGILGRWRIMRAVPILGGFAAAITLKPVVKQYLLNLLPITMQMPLEKWFGIITIATGGIISTKARRRVLKDVGLGMIVGGVYDVIATNFANLPFIPKVTPGYLPGASAETASGMGSSIGQGSFATVGASNISMDMEPDVIGCEDLDDMI